MNRQAEKTAERILKTHRILRPPIPLEQIVEAAGIELLTMELDADTSGALVQLDHGAIVLAVNQLHHRNRRRFTIAHELGHHFLNHLELHPHVDREFTVIKRNEISSKAIDSREVAANAFAAYLLMPESFLIKDFSKNGGFANDDLLDLANRYQVSEQALRFRLANLGMMPPY